MKRPAPLAVAAGVHLALALTVACGSVHAEQEDPQEAPGYTEADVRFLQEMIVHHGQALEMTALVPERTARDDIRMLARRIEVAQRDEIARMRQWLEDRGEEVPSLDGLAAHGERGSHDAAGRGRSHDRGDHGQAGQHHGAREHGGQAHGAPEHAGMPGMLNREQLSRLAEAEAEEFDRLFLEHMIFHHEGALVMVGGLFSAPGAAQETEIYMLASHIDADQRAEIERMRRLLDAAAENPWR